MAAEVPTEAVVRASPDRGQAESWTLVLEAMAIPHRVVPTDIGFAVMVPPKMVAPAMAALDAQDKEAAEGLARDQPPPDHGPSFVGMGVGITLVAFFVVAGPRTGPDLQGWFRQGSAVSDAIVHNHEVWRAVTALTLHADIMHVAGNTVASLVFVTALGRWLGGGLAVLATLLAGVAGNLLTAYIYKTSHNVVGASTSTFGALGVLGGLQFVRRFRLRAVGRLRRAMLGIAAALGLLAMLGMGERSDVVAHATGTGFGVLFGALLGLGLRRSVRNLGQALALLSAVAILVGAWLLAFGHGSW
ncbi:MAG TPA: rhomboid family intramembrane serine protease [Polyangia bacterium]